MILAVTQSAVAATSTDMTVSNASITAIASVIGAIVTGVSVYLVAKVGRKTGRESQGVQALGEAVDGYRELLGDTRRDLQDQITALRKQNGHQADQITHLTEQNDNHEEKIGRLEKLLAAAYRYIELFRDDYRRRDLSPPAPPADYIDPT